LKVGLAASWMIYSGDESCVVFGGSRWFGRGVVCEADRYAIPVRCWHSGLVAWWWWCKGIEMCRIRWGGSLAFPAPTRLNVCTTQESFQLICLQWLDIY
jgi:hypothetical protein